MSTGDIPGSKSPATISNARDDENGQRKTLVAKLGQNVALEEGSVNACFPRESGRKGRALVFGHSCLAPRFHSLCPQFPASLDATALSVAMALRAMCGWPPVGKGFLIFFTPLVGAAMMGWTPPLSDRASRSK